MAKIRKIYDQTVKPDGQQTAIYPITSTRAVYTTTNITIDTLINEGYRFGGVVLPDDGPAFIDQRVFYAASIPGTYTNFASLAVNAGEAAFFLWDGTSWEKKVFGGASHSTLTGFVALSSIEELPLEATTLGYLIRSESPEALGWPTDILYVWVGENGDTLDGKYLSCGQLRGASAYEVAVRNGYEGTEQEWLEDPVNGAKGVGIAEVEETTTTSAPSGTNVITVTLQDDREYTFEVKNGVGIVDVTETPSPDNDGLNVLTFTLSDDTTWTATTKNGTGIASITETASTVSGGNNTITINLSDGTHYDVVVKNGYTPDITPQVTQLPSGTQPTVNISGTLEEPFITFGIPAATVESELDTALVTQSTGSSTTNVMSQKATSDELAKKIEARDVTASITEVPSNYYTKAETLDYVTSRISDNLTTNDATQALSAKQGKALKDLIDEGYLYKGIAAVATNPGTPSGKIFYIATEAGTYTNFGSLVVADGEVAILKYNGSAWSKDTTGAATAAEVSQLGQEVGYFYGYTSSVLPNIDTNAKTIDLGGDFVLINKGARYIITNRAVPLYDSSAGSSLQKTLYNLTDGTFRVAAFSAVQSDGEILFGVTRFNVSGAYIKSYFPFTYLEDHIYNMQGSQEGVSAFYADKVLNSLGRLDDLTPLFELSKYNYVSTSEHYWKDDSGASATNIIGFKRGVMLRLLAGDTIIVDTGAQVRPYLFFDDGTVYSSYRTTDYTLSKDAYCILEVRYSPVSTITDIGDLASKIHIVRDISAYYNDWNVEITTDVSEPDKSVYAASNRYNPQYKVVVGSEQTIITNTGYRSAIRYIDASGNTIVDYGWVESGLINSHKALPGAVFVDIMFEKKDGTAMVDSNYSTKAEAVNANCSIISIESFNLVKRSVSTQAPGALIIDSKMAKSIRSIAHQGFYGFSGGYGNNMAEYYAKAAKYGFDYGECDIKFSSDNVPVCCHDATFTDEATETTITIAEHTYAELQTYTYHGGKISSFDDIVKTCKVNGIGLYVDHITSLTDEQFSIVAGIIKKYSFERNVVWLVNSGATIIVPVILAFDKRATISVLCDALDATVISYASSIATDFNDIRINFQYSSTSISTIESLAATIPGGITLETYTVDGFMNYRKYLPYVGGITSNRVNESFVGRYV